MMITLTIYICIIGYIIFKAFYVSIKPFNNSTNTLLFQDSISLSAMRFYSNMEKINLFAFFINFIFLSFISFSLLPDLISNSIAYCQDSSEEESSFDNSFQWRIAHNSNNSDHILKMIEETYKISSTKRPFIYHSNYKYIGITDYLKVFHGLSYDSNDIINKQNVLFTNGNFIKFLSNENDKNVHMKMYNKSIDLLSLNANAYKKAIFLYKNSDSLISFLNEESNESFELFNKILNNKINNTLDIDKNIRGFIGGNEINNLYKTFINFFNSLENIKEIAKINLLQKGIILKDEKIIIKNPYELENYCDKKLILTLEKELNERKNYYLNHQLENNKSFDIHKKINNKHNSYYIDSDKINVINNKGFFLKENLETNNYYEPFNRDSMDKDMVIKYDRFINKKKFKDEIEVNFNREIDEDF